MDRVDPLSDDEEPASVDPRLPQCKRRISKHECRNYCCWMLPLISSALMAAEIAVLLCMIYDHSQGLPHSSGTAMTHTPTQPTSQSRTVLVLWGKHPHSHYERARGGCNSTIKGSSHFNSTPLKGPTGIVGATLCYFPHGGAKSNGS